MTLIVGLKHFYQQGKRQNSLGELICEVAVIVDRREVRYQS